MKILCGLLLFICFLTIPLSAPVADDFRIVEFAKTGNLKQLRSLLREAVEVNTSTADGTTALHWAVRRDDLEMIDLLISAGADADQANDLYGVTPLWLACTNRNDTIVAKLLQAGANPDSVTGSGESVLMNCARTGSSETVKQLLVAGADVNVRENSRGQTALMWAAASGHADVVELLIKHGAKVNSTTPASDITRTKHSCGVCTFEPVPGGFTPLLFAARSGDLATARRLLDAGAELNKASPEHGNALVIASAGGHFDLAIYLLGVGADPDSADETGLTALHHSIAAGLAVLNGVIYDPVYRIMPTNNLVLARALLDSGADVNSRITRPHLSGPDGTPFSMVGATPFLLAAASVDIPMMNLLREYGADTTINTEDGITPLMAAIQAVCAGTCAYQGDNIEKTPMELRPVIEAVKLLVEQTSADVNAADSAGETAMHYAAFTGAAPVVQYLADHGAQINVKSNRGETPWSKAVGMSPDASDSGLYGVHKNTTALLLQLGAEQISPGDLVSRYNQQYLLGQ